MPQHDDDPLAPIERILSERDREKRRERGERRERQETARGRPSMTREQRASEIVAKLDPQIQADVERLGSKFAELVASEEWRRLSRMTRRLEGVDTILLDPMTVSLERERAYLPDDAGADRSAVTQGAYRWFLGSELYLEWHGGGWPGYFHAVFAAFESFGDLAVVEPVSEDIDASEPTIRRITIHHNGKTAIEVVGRSEARAILALTTARLLELVEKDQIVEVAVKVLRRGRE
jgi:hypothetical protein